MWGTVRDIASMSRRSVPSLRDSEIFLAHTFPATDVAGYELASLRDSGRGGGLRKNWRALSKPHSCERGL